MLVLGDPIRALVSPPGLPLAAMTFTGLRQVPGRSIGPGKFREQRNFGS
jgi:hypothetical protein